MRTYEIETRVRLLLDGGYGQRIRSAAAGFEVETRDIADGTATYEAKYRCRAFRDALRSAIVGLYGQMTAGSYMDASRLAHALANSLCAGRADLREAVEFAQKGAQALGLITDVFQPLEGYLIRQYSQIVQLREGIELDALDANKVAVYRAAADELTLAHLDLMVTLDRECVPGSLHDVAHEIASIRLNRAIENSHTGSQYLDGWQKVLYLVLVGEREWKQHQNNEQD